MKVPMKDLLREDAILWLIIAIIIPLYMRGITIYTETGNIYLLALGLILLVIFVLLRTETKARDLTFEFDKLEHYIESGMNLADMIGQHEDIADSETKEELSTAIDDLLDEEEEVSDNVKR